MANTGPEARPTQERPQNGRCPAINKGVVETQADMGTVPNISRCRAVSILPLGPTATRKERLFNDFESRRRHVELAEFSHLDEPGVLGIAPGMRLSLEVSTKDIDEHIVPMNSVSFFLDEVRHGNHLDGSHLDLGLLAGLSDHGLLHRLSDLDGPSGDTPPTLGRRIPSTDEEDLRAAEHDRADRGDGARGEFVRRHFSADKDATGLNALTITKVGRGSPSANSRRRSVGK